MTAGPYNQGGMNFLCLVPSPNTPLFDLANNGGSNDVRTFIWRCGYRRRLSDNDLTSMGNQDSHMPIIYLRPPRFCSSVIPSIGYQPRWAQDLLLSVCWMQEWNEQTSHMVQPALHWFRFTGHREMPCAICQNPPGLEFSFVSAGRTSCPAGFNLDYRG